MGRRVDHEVRLGAEGLDLALVDRDCRHRGDQVSAGELDKLQAEAAATWRSPQNRKPTVRGVERLRAWCEGFSLHAGVVIANHDREALERLRRYGTRPAFAQERLDWTANGQSGSRAHDHQPRRRRRPAPETMTITTMDAYDLGVNAVVTLACSRRCASVPGARR